MVIDGLPVPVKSYNQILMEQEHNQSTKGGNFNMVNYAEEVIKHEAFTPEQGSDFWSPVAGQYKVKALTEMEDTEPYKKEGEPDKPRVKISIQIGGDIKNWTMAVGKTSASTYGQLCKVASENNNTLVGVEFTVVVVNDGSRNSYTVVR